MGWGLAAMSLVSAGVQAFGQYRQAKDQESAAEEAASINRQEAQQALVASKFDVMKARRAGKFLLGEQIATSAKSGVVFEGSPVDVALDTMEQIELDIMITNYNANVAAGQKMSEAGQREKQARSYGRQAIVSPLATLLTSGTDIYKNFGGGSNATTT